MKLLILSDTHDSIYNARKAIESNPDISMVLHLGDLCRDAIKLSQLYPDKSLEYVYGNCDFGVGTVSAEKTIEIEGVRIFMTHGNKYNVKWNLNRIVEKAEAENASVVLFGHTHIPFVNIINNILVVNPGSATESRSGSFESYAILEVSKSKVDANICYL